MPAEQEFNIHGGVHCADFVGRDKITYGFGPQDVERLIEKVLGYLQAGAVFLPDPQQPERLQIEHDGQKLVFHPGAAARLAAQGSLRSYLLALTIDQEYQRWATRFVPLAGKMDIRQVIEGLPIAFTEIIIPTGEGGLGSGPTQRKLDSIAEAMHSHPAFVILGEPGAGKTTTLQRIAYDAARARLENQSVRIPLFVRLSQQGAHDPYGYLQSEWERRSGIPFQKALNQGALLILADGINEVPRQKRDETLKAWMLFVQQYRGANQIIFSGREADYDNQLNLPRVLVEPLDENRIADFLQRHEAEGLADLLEEEDSPLRALASNPLNLFVLVMVYLQGGKNLALLANRGRVFETFARWLLEKEQRWHGDGLSVDSKVDLLARLAYEMQCQGSGTTLTLAAARGALPAAVANSLGEEIPVEPSALIHFCRGATILDPATRPDVRFYHHVLQEYFAARELLRRFNAGESAAAWWQAPRLADEMPEAGVGEWDPLPESPGTGWEVTTLLACGLSRDPARLIEAVRQHNPILAGRCLVEAGLPPLPESGEGGAASGRLGVRAKVQQNLLDELYNPAVHLRTRLQAGFVLGQAGDPRFQTQLINGVKIILPQMVGVPGGCYTIGSAAGEADSFDDEKPQDTIELPAFSIGKWPVTNAEYACFMQAGGYEDERWWETDLARRWLRGEEVTGGQMQSWLQLWQALQQMSNVRQVLEQSGNFTPDQVDTYEQIARMTEDKLKASLASSLSQKSRSQPAYWDDRRFNNLSQPVVGITWFEARAYCAWLTAVTGREYRLPSEVEWEAAARGKPAHRYPWGDTWEAGKANTIEGRLMKPSPVGAYTAAGSLRPSGAEDQAGSVWEWTASLYRPYPYEPVACEQPEAEGERSLRGGSWDYGRRYARCACRSRGVPVNFADDIGFRVVSPGIFLNSAF